MANTQSRTLEFTPEALDVLNNMASRLGTIERTFGAAGPEHAKAMESFATSILTLIRMGGRVMPDGDLSLIVATQVGIVMGVNWHGYKVTRDGYDAIVEKWQIAGSWSCNS